MANVMFTVKATITPEREDAFNQWYNTEHCPDMLEKGGVASARRFKPLLGDDSCQYMAVYEFESEEKMQAFLDSDFFTWMLAEYDSKFGAVSTRVRQAYVQVWP